MLISIEMIINYYGKINDYSRLYIKNNNAMS